VRDLANMLAKAKRAVVRRGIAEQDADELVQEAFLRIERYERDQTARSREALLVTAAVNLSIDRRRRDARAPFADVSDLANIADSTPDPHRSWSSKGVSSTPRPAWKHCRNEPAAYCCGGVSREAATPRSRRTRG